MDLPDPKYVKTEDGVYIAYQVVGDGPADIAWQLDFGGSLDVWWDAANSWGAWFEELASFGRLILHDWRGHRAVEQKRGGGQHGDTGG